MKAVCATKTNLLNTNSFDVIGDLYLLGRPILGEFVGYMSGHALNNKLARAVLRCDDAWDTVGYSVGEPGRTKPILHPEASSAV